MNIKKIIRLFKKRNKDKQLIAYYGNNWHTSTNKMPIAILFGFMPWKREVVSSYLSEYRTLYFNGKVTFAKYVKLLKILKDEYFEGEEIVFIGWGTKIPWWLNLYAHLKNIHILTMEDGFLRSVGIGLLHTRPLSLSLDSRGIYFNAHKPSEIEYIIQHLDNYLERGMIDRAKKAIELFVNARLTKYYPTDPFSGNKIEKGRRYSIAVIGQVEEDASIVMGKAKIKSNLELVQAARKDFPDADIYYRPHPDEWTGNRVAKSSLNKIKEIAAIVPPESSILELFYVVDHLYTMTSLVGLEALMHGLTVTTFGAPFYAGWGLTDDRVHIARRTRKVTIEELFSVAYFIYPRYLHNNSDEIVSFEETAGYFIVDILKDKNIFELKDNTLFKNISSSKEGLSVPLDLLFYLQNTGNFSSAVEEDFNEIVYRDFKLRDFPQISLLLYRTSNYDILVSYCNYCIDYLSSNIHELIENKSLLESFFYSLNLSLQNSNGRVINRLGNYNKIILDKLGISSIYHKILFNYLNCLSSGLQYDVIEDFFEMSVGRLEANTPVSYEIHWDVEKQIDSLRKASFDFAFFRKIVLSLQKKPYRSEREPNVRHDLIIKSANQYLRLLNERYNEVYFSHFNNSLYWMLLDEPVEVEKTFKKMMDFLNNSDEYTNAGSTKLRKSFLKRKSEIINLANYSIRNGLWKIADTIIDWVFNEKNEQVELLKLNYYKERFGIERAIAYYNTLTISIIQNHKFKVFYARCLRELGMFTEALHIYKECFIKASTVAQKNNLFSEIQKIDFLIESSYILNSVVQPKIPKGVIFLASQTCFNTLAMMIPSLVELKKMGYAVINLMAGMTEVAPTGLSYIDRFEGIIPMRLYDHSLKHEWTIDWPKKLVCAEKINFYQGFYERLSTLSRRYYVDLNMAHINREFIIQLKRSDISLSICKQIYTDIVGRGIPAIFVSGNSHVTPFSVFRDFARDKQHPLLSYINCNVAYESYFSNLGSKFANTMCVTDMTLYPNIRAPFMARKDNFDRWYEVNKDNKQYMDEVNNLLHMNRVGSVTSTKENELIDYLQLQRSKGKKIICAFGKVPVDLNVPFDGGPAHMDMADWINHTVEVCGKSSDIILLVKPHPHELRPEIALDLVEGFNELITVPIRDNVHLLGHKDINVHALAPYLDLAILYNGSSSLELTALGIPVLLTSYFGKYDYPINMIYPSSRSQYENFILDMVYPEPDEDLRKQAALLICYLGTSEISTINQYSLRQLTNDRMGPPKWRENKIKKFLKEGDPNMLKIAKKIVEKVEGNGVS